MTDQLHAPEDTRTAVAANPPAPIAAPTPTAAPTTDQPAAPQPYPPGYGYPPAQAPYGQAPWPYQPGPWPQPSYPAGAPAQKSRFGLGILLGVVLGIGLALIGLIILVLASGVGAPANLGDSAYTDSLYGMCDEGNMAACDLLYWDSAVGSELEEFGATCGGRINTWQYGSCAESGLEPQ